MKSMSFCFFFFIILLFIIAYLRLSTVIMNCHSQFILMVPCVS